MQIAKNEEQTMQAKKDFELEGKILRANQAAEKEKLERIKRDKLKELDKLAIPEKYKAELFIKKITSSN